MLGKQKIWNIQEYNREKAGFYAAELGISSLVTGILLERGFNDVDSAGKNGIRVGDEFR